ncbi:pentapeptide repeat-containing protein [Hyphobacterium sp.]|uniref:pentapeptide repeat-containing protein n=1 Tax=Hyphobacterium sp. TaxID=2004662 RepID=UPI0037488ED8
MRDKLFQEETRQKPLGAFGGVFCVLTAIFVALTVTAPSWANHQCRLVFDNRLDQAFELVDGQNNVLGNIRPTGLTTIVVTALSGLNNIQYSVRFPGSLNPNGFSGYPPRYRFTLEVWGGGIYERDGTTRIYSRQELTNCLYHGLSVPGYYNGYWADERSLELERTGIMLGVEAQSSGISLVPTEGRGQERDTNRLGILTYVFRGPVFIGPPERVALRRPGECRNDIEGITCQAQLNISREVFNWFAETAENNRIHDARCEAANASFYVAAPRENMAFGDIVFCRPPAELNRDIFAGTTVRANFTGTNLERFNFEGAVLAGSNLSGARLTGTNFVGADLSGVDLSGTDLQGANLSRANLTGANLTNTNLNRAILHNATFTGADMRETRLEGADLTGANLTNVQNIAYFNINEETVLCNTTGYNGEVINYNCITPTQFRDADQSNRNYSGRDLAGYDFTNRNLQGVNFSGSNLTGANFQGANLTNTNFNRAILRNATFTGADMRETRLEGADLTGANLTNVQNIAYFNINEETVLCNTTGYNGEVINYNCITPTQFRDTDQSNRNYSGRDLAGYDFTNRNLQGVNFSGSNLTGANFQGANLTNANLENANLTSADISRANLNGARFAGADLTRATMLQSQFDTGIFQRFDGTVFCETVAPDGQVSNHHCPQGGR